MKIYIDFLHVIEKLKKLNLLFFNVTSACKRIDTWKVDLHGVYDCYKIIKCQ